MLPIPAAWLRAAATLTVERLDDVGDKNQVSRNHLLPFDRRRHYKSQPDQLAADGCMH